MKNGDIFKWSWTAEEFEKRKNNSSLYYCSSRICVLKGNCLIDTYWISDLDNVHFKNVHFQKDSKDIDLKFIANLSDLEKVPEYFQAYYLDEDCVNLNHANNISGNFYIRKGAVRNLDKMKRLKNRELMEIRREIESLQRTLKYNEQEIASMTVESSVSVRKGIPLDDHSYMDNE